jgi:hypothetical protein
MVVLKTLADGTTPDWEATVSAMLEIIGETGVQFRRSMPARCSASTCRSGSAPVSSRTIAISRSFAPRAGVSGPRLKP